MPQAARLAAVFVLAMPLWAGPLAAQTAAPPGTSATSSAATTTLPPPPSLGALLRWAAADVQAQLQAAGNATTPPALRGLLARTHDPARLEQAGAAEWAARAGALDRAALAAWWQGPVGARVAAADVSRALPPPHPCMQPPSRLPGCSAAEQALQDRWLALPPARRAVLERVARASQLAGTLLSVRTYAMLAAGIDDASRAAGRVAGPWRLQAQTRVRALGPEALPRYQQMAQAALAQAYAALPDDDLLQWAAFLESPTGAAWQRAVAAALETTLLEAGDETARALAQLQPVRR